MALILCVDTSSKNCSVALSKDGIVIYTKEKLEEGYCHGEELHSLIEDLFLDAKLEISQIDAISFSSGPGSYTGLRIGAATAKGLGIALNKKIVLVSTLKAMCWGFINNEQEIFNNDVNYFCSVLDSRQGEVYASIYDVLGSEILPPFACEVAKSPFINILNTNKICFFGTGLYKLKKVINHKNASFYDGFLPSSSYLAFLAENNYNQKKFADIAYFEPMYLKGFIAS